MIRINLLPAGMEATPTRINPAIPVSIAVIVPAILLIPFHVQKMAAQKKLQTEVVSLKNQLDTYTPIIRQVEALESQKVQLTQRKGVIEQLERERLRYPQFFDDFVKLIPNNVWLTNLVTSILPTNNSLSVNMDVTALDSYAIADLISNLEASQIFTEVDLVGAISTTQAAGGGSLLNFKVSTNYKKADTPADANKKS